MALHGANTGLSQGSGMMVLIKQQICQARLQQFVELGFAMESPGMHLPSVLHLPAAARLHAPCTPWLCRALHCSSHLRCSCPRLSPGDLPAVPLPLLLPSASAKTTESTITGNAAKYQPDHITPHGKLQVQGFNSPCPSCITRQPGLAVPLPHHTLWLQPHSCLGWGCSARVS